MFFDWIFGTRKKTEVKRTFPGEQPQTKSTVKPLRKYTPKFENECDCECDDHDCFVDEDCDECDCHDDE